MLRESYVDYLIHWVTAPNDGAACEKLLDIIGSQKIVGHCENIKGAYRCICFTDAAPQDFDFNIIKYRPFGIMLSKPYIFNHGGRPVIYQPGYKYNDLPESLRWCHVRCEPPINFTWEREWRVKLDWLYLPYGEASIIVPNKEWAEWIIAEFNKREWTRYQGECTGYGWILARYPEHVGYRIFTINWA